MTTIFIDGEAGTTGLKIHHYLQELQKAHPDLALLTLEETRRKELKAREEALNSADVVFLCLPDSAAREALSLIHDPHTRVIDASSAHRALPNWVYGLPELYPHKRQEIKNAKYVSVPGCHATGAMCLLYPLLSQGLLPRTYPLHIHSLTGYSGGGKNLIQEYERELANPNWRNSKFLAPRPYALELEHKHLPELIYHLNLAHKPILTPVAGPFYQGLLVSISIFTRLLPKPLEIRELYEFFKSYYEHEAYINILPPGTATPLDHGFLTATDCNGTNRLDIHIFGDQERWLLVARLDNLGKGAALAALQNMQIMLNLPEIAKRPE